MKRLILLALFSSLCAGAAHFGVFYFLKIRAPMMRTPVEQDFKVYYLNNTSDTADPAAVQQGILMDSAPLFMPTRWNLGSDLSEVASLQQATEVFRNFPPDLELPDYHPSSPWSQVPVDEWALPPLNADPQLLLSRYGRTPLSIPESDGGGAQVVALLLDGSASESRSTLSLPVDLNERSPQVLWNPAIFYLHVTLGLPVGSPLMIQSSGYTDWDLALQRYLGSLDFYRFVGNGYFRISIYP